MSKAYDRLEWRFILRNLRAMGFSSTVQYIIFLTLSNLWYSVNINGVTSTEFRLTRGVQQGDPLSPFLFILASENYPIQNGSKSHGSFSPSIRR